MLEDPILAVSAHTEMAYNDAQMTAIGINSMHSWRNELIDACIVRCASTLYLQILATFVTLTIFCHLPFDRYLKSIARSTSGDFSSSSGASGTAVSLDLLSNAVKSSLEERCNVSVDDVVRRSERLVSIGVIEKCVGNPNTLRSIAYSYLPESTEVSHSIASSQSLSTSSSSYLNTRPTGSDLYDHLRIVLNIRSVTTGISLMLFTNKFHSWISRSPMSIGGGNKSTLVYNSIIDSILDHVRSSCQQLHALKVQHAEGLLSETIGVDKIPYSKYEKAILSGVHSLSSMLVHFKRTQMFQYCQILIRSGSSCDTPMLSAQSFDGRSVPSLQCISLIYSHLIYFLIIFTLIHSRRIYSQD